MTQAGGPAAINGFLYQILHHLGWMAEVSLSGTLDGIEMREASLILEPRTGGEAFHSATYERQWSLLAAVLNAADPYLLTDRDDPLWLGNVLSDELPAVFGWHARKVLQQRKDR